MLKRSISGGRKRRRRRSSRRRSSRRRRSTRRRSRSKSVGKAGFLFNPKNKGWMTSEGYRENESQKKRRAALKRMIKRSGEKKTMQHLSGAHAYASRGSVGKANTWKDMKWLEETYRK